MNSYWTKHFLNFLFFTLVQVLVLNNLQISWLLNPFVYVAFILLLPLEISGWLLLVFSFLAGLTIDIFANTPGMHASATLFMGFLRPYVHRGIIPREDYQTGTQPSAGSFGFAWFVRYTVIMVFIHHTFLFFLEALSLGHLFSTLLKTGVSTFASVVIIAILQLFSFSKSKSR
jgi:rod shape-determining protein MreD